MVCCAFFCCEYIMGRDVYFYVFSKSILIPHFDTDTKSIHVTIHTQPHCPESSCSQLESRDLQEHYTPPTTTVCAVTMCLVTTMVTSTEFAGRCFLAKCPCFVEIYCFFMVSRAECLDVSINKGIILRMSFQYLKPVKCGNDPWIGSCTGMHPYPDSKVHEANMRPIWGWQDPGGPHVGPMNFAIWVSSRLRGSIRTCLLFRLHYGYCVTVPVPVKYSWRIWVKLDSSNHKKTQWVFGMYCKCSWWFHSSQHILWNKHLFFTTSGNIPSWTMRCDKHLIKPHMIMNIFSCTLGIKVFHMLKIFKCNALVCKLSDDLCVFWMVCATKEIHNFFIQIHCIVKSVDLD